jgi:hypothetical protein
MLGKKESHLAPPLLSPSNGVKKRRTFHPQKKGLGDNQQTITQEQGGLPFNVSIPRLLFILWSALKGRAQINTQLPRRIEKKLRIKR